jgi:hypothetical protein
MTAGDHVSRLSCVPVLVSAGPCVERAGGSHGLNSFPRARLSLWVRKCLGMTVARQRIIARWRPHGQAAWWVRLAPNVGSKGETETVTAKRDEKGSETVDRGCPETDGRCGNRDCPELPEVWLLATGAGKRLGGGCRGLNLRGVGGRVGGRGEEGGAKGEGDQSALRGGDGQGDGRAGTRTSVAREGSNRGVVRRSEYQLAAKYVAGVGRSREAR